MRASDVLTAIDQATWTVRKDEDSLLKTMKSASDDIARLRSEQTEQYKALAIIRLDELAKSSLVPDVSALERRAKEGFLTFKEKAKELEQKRQELETLLAKKEAEQPVLMNRLEDAQAALSAHSEATLKRLQNDEGWQNFSRRAEGITHKITAAEQKAKASERDREEKSKPYHADNLFVYLRDRQYGTSGYKGSILSRWGDAYISRVIHYEEARQNYFLLNEIPKRLEEHVNNVRKGLDDLQNEQENYFRKELEHDDIAPFEKTAADIADKLVILQKEIRDLENTSIVVNVEYQRLLHGDHPKGLNAVVAELVAALKREDMRVLMHDAVQTPTSKDEQIVEKLQVLEKNIAALEGEIKKIRETLRIIAQKRTELERSREDFNSARYGNHGGVFVNDKIIGDILGGMIGGVLTSRELRDALRQGYREPPRRRRNDDFFGGGWGGGMGGGGGWGGGGSGGGGFRTGGGF